MSLEAKSGGWDFTPVLDLINSLYTTVENPLQIDVATSSSDTQATLTPGSGELNTSDGLGNFDKLWEYLGESNAVSSQNLKTVQKTHSFETVNDTSVNNKVVSWCDEAEAANLVESEQTESKLNLPRLDETSREGEPRKKYEKNQRFKSSTKAAFSGLENESGGDDYQSKCSSRRAVIQEIIHGTHVGEKQAVPSSAEYELKRRPISDVEGSPLVNRRMVRRSLAAVLLSEQDPYVIAAEKKRSLIDKLRKTFVEEKKYLNALGMIPSTVQKDKDAVMGIHIFIDASNIMIGFHDSLKLSRGFSMSSRIRRQPMSFHNLSIILERGRPAAKRVLVGSDNFPAILEAKESGYETNILERVHKAKELTPRQRKRYSTKTDTSSNGVMGQSSGSETNATFYASEKRVEQAVDEILHLKILESVVDAKKPATIVLATGDAAEAEYSEGFLKMVERALEKSWKVELVSFKRNISGAYRKKDFKSRWGSKFKIIELDEYVEELLGA